jgi:hypothetical protein
VLLIIKSSLAIPVENQYSTIGSEFTRIPMVNPLYLYEANKYVFAESNAAERVAPEYGPYLASPGAVVFASILSLKFIAIYIFINFFMILSRFLG